MADLSQPVAYRGLALNDVERVGKKLVGNQLNRIDFSDVRAVGYTEKRSMSDGDDASDVFLSARRVLLNGTTYGESKADMHDRLQALRSAFTPTGAYLEDPTNFGYRPLTFYEPTLLEELWPEGYRWLKLNARPLMLPSFSFQRDVHGGDDALGNGINWDILMGCKDPRVYVNGDVSVDLAHTGSSGSGDLTNRGDYPSPLSFLLVVPSSASAGTFTLTVGGTQLIVTIPNSTVAQVFRYDGYNKVLTVEESSVNTLRMDLLNLVTENTHPTVPPGTSSYTWSTTSDITTNSRLFFAEAYA